MGLISGVLKMVCSPQGAGHVLHRVHVTNIASQCSLAKLFVSYSQ